MRTNKLKQNLKAGRVTSLCQLYFPSTTMVELIGKAGFDCVLLDGEHGTIGPESLDDLCRTAELVGITPIARVPNIEASTIQSYLDRGVLGILGPGIDTAEDARQLVDACLYPPVGRRGVGGAPRGADFRDVSAESDIERTNAETLVVAFLEHVEAMSNLDEIVAVEGIDSYYVGPADTALSLGVPGELDHPEVKGFEDRVREAAQAAGKPYFDDVTVGAQATHLFLDGARSFLEANRTVLAQA